MRFGTSSRARGLLLSLSIFALLLGGFSFSFQPKTTHAQELTDAQKAALQAQYDQLQIEIAQWQKVLDDTEAKKGTLQGDVTALNAQIKQAQAEIAQRNTTIATLGSEIAQKSATISTLQASIQSGQESLAKLLREKNQAETSSLVVLAFSAQSLSEFLSDADTVDSIDRQMQAQFDQLRGTQTQTEQERAALNATQAKEQDAEFAVQLKKQTITANQIQQKQLLAITTSQAADYAKVLAQNKAKAAAIRAALFPLRDASSINFGDALAYAQEAQKSTGVDPALILAVLTQESNLGVNVGQCYLTDDTTGAGVGKNTGTPFANVMKPSRDVPPFLALSASLGFDPHHQVVSCPIASAGGYGGAMGPAQFIPSTWATYAPRIATASGDPVPNPWGAKDAITAMSLYFADLGAGEGGYTAEHMAAAKYYAGGAWATAGRAYGNQVMTKVASIQQNIDFLTAH